MEQLEIKTKIGFLQENFGMLQDYDPNQEIWVTEGGMLYNWDNNNYFGEMSIYIDAKTFKIIKDNALEICRY